MTLDLPTGTATLVVLAKAPEPGKAKTRLCPPATREQAADLAAAALLDTLDATTAVRGAATVVAFIGSLPAAARAAELAAALARTSTTPQRGESLGERIAAAHADAHALHPGLPTLQVGMDTPQVDAGLLVACLDRLLSASVDAVLGLAVDGGWWALGLRDPRQAALIAGIPTSRDDTGARTLAALRAAGLHVELLPELIDVDTAVDAVAVAALAPRTRFAAAVATLVLAGAAS